MSIQDVNVKGGKKYRYRVYYYDKVEKKQKQKNSKYFDSYNEAREAEIEFLYEITHDSGKKIAPWKRDKVTTFHIAYMQWFDWSVSGRSLAYRTIEEKQRVVEIYYSSLMNIPMEEITVQNIKDCFASEHFVELSTVRKNRVLAILRSIFRFANTYLGIDNNPTDYFRNFNKTDEESLKRVVIYDVDQFNLFLEMVPSRYMNYHNLFYVLYWTGMRLNEANSLTFKDVDMIKHKINIYRQWDVDKQEWSTLKTPNARRKITIDSDIERIIREQRQVYSTFKDFSDDWFIFGGRKQLAYTSIERHKNKACLKAGLPKVKIHSFRHAHASYLLSHGVPLFKVSRRLGHSSVSITADIYGQFIEDMDDDILSAIRNKT